MATSKIAVTEGAGKNVATNSFTEDAVTKEVQRVVPNTSAGIEVVQGMPVPVTPSAVNSVAASASSVVVLAANANRKPGSMIWNDSTSIMYIKLGTTATASDYYHVIDGKTTVPGSFAVPDGYLGIIHAIWVTATGNSRAVEMT